MFPRQIYYIIIGCCPNKVKSCWWSVVFLGTLLGVTGGLGDAPLPGFPRYSSP